MESNQKIDGQKILFYTLGILLGLVQAILIYGEFTYKPELPDISGSFILILYWIPVNIAGYLFAFASAKKFKIISRIILLLSVIQTIATILYLMK